MQYPSFWRLLCSVLLAAGFLGCASNLEPRKRQSLSEHAAMCSSLVDLAARIAAAETTQGEARTLKGEKMSSAPAEWQTARRQWYEAEKRYSSLRRKFLQRNAPRRLKAVTENAKQLADQECIEPTKSEDKAAVNKTATENPVEPPGGAPTGLAQP